jgi:hypothetical protein
MNPLLNPYMNQGPTGRTSALLYFMSAQQATGGLGSGLLSSSRPALAAGARGGKAPAQMPLTMSTPGGGASRYFQRGVAPTQNRRGYYQRQNRYFANNGR